MDYFPAIPDVSQSENDFKKCIWAFKGAVEAKHQNINFIIIKLLPVIEKDSTQDENLIKDLPQNNKKVIELLLNYKSELGLTRNDYSLLILLAAKIGNEDIFTLVLNDCRKSIDSITEDERKADQEEMKDPFIRNFHQKPILPPREPQELNYQGPFGRTALHYAVRQQLPEVVQFLLDQGADVNSKTIGYYTPLHYACCLENEEIVKILLSSGADVNVISSQKTTALHLVCGRCDFRQIFNRNHELYYEEYYSTFGYRMNPFYEPKLVINLKIMKLLLTRGANPEVLGEHQTNSLHEACRAGHLEAVKLLLSSGAELRTLGKENNSPIHYATTGNCCEIIDLLLKNGWDIETKNVNGYTPLHYVTQYERITVLKKLKMIKYLEDLGADVNARHLNGGTALHIAAYFDKPEIIECLIGLGADLKLRCYENSSPVIGYNMVDASMIGQSPQGPGMNILLSYIAMKENHLGDYINSYLRDGSVDVNSIFQKYKLELDKLKSRRIVQDARISFYDFLTRDFFSAFEIVKIEEIRSRLESGQYEIDPCYKFLIQKRFERIKELVNFVEKTVNFLKKYGEVKLPIFVIKIVLSYLSWQEFRNFGRALSVKGN